MLTTLLDLAGLLLLVAFAFVCWPPAALAVAGVAVLLVSRQVQAGRASVRRS